MDARSQRRRLACAECTRKKIKCDKVIPCRNCSRRGRPCYRLPQQTTSERAIQDCLQELQATLRVVRQSQTATPVLEDGTISVPSSPEQQSLLPEPVPSRSDRPEMHSAGVNEDTEVEDAATILEFLAWGRRKVPAYGSPHRSLGDVTLDDELDLDETSHLRLTNDSPLDLLQLLLPKPKCLQEIVRYHCDCLLWYHASFHAIVFQSELGDFVNKYGCNVQNANVDLQWVALLFAVLTGSMTCAPPTVALSWGFHEQERSAIARRWFKAALVCLHRADYTSNHSIYSVECIATMTMSAHMLGHSNSHSVMLATAVRIAQSLGLHLLGSSAHDHPNSLVRKEIGRRVWTELCIQDWFSIPFSESYLIHLLDFNTGTPINCKEDDMVPLPDEVPTSVTYYRVLYQVARLMPWLQDDMAKLNTLYTKYEHVLRYDAQMRTLVSKVVPLFLKNAPLHPSWPCYVPWARHCLIISLAHKIIMVYRKFLWPSFTNLAFSFTLKTCIAASKTILRECKQVAEEEGPILWIYHAFAVAASIILCLDLLFQPPLDAEHHGHRELVEDTIAILSRSNSSMIAKRGLTILRLLSRAEEGQSLPGSSQHELAIR
ncbi:uncharacterized protein DSM5745_07948 [Aspergillus mulundensis]|uniref:Zn(2)-C6 fungal-type domain-containing protein n=1 Tax=Aspergillus mulundensis TaxID=1810919 RepID=A0A3D8RFN6_9EURO|nr:Uncharacterized protein DSM5745_07948 [Aspergillus mulundensis]RDW72776.1 Uncharacterized protein DSM5745_07948 [Aspergillus mulundensis]